MTDLQPPKFINEDAAREALEAIRWPNGPYCPHCGNADPERIAKVEGTKRSHRPGLYYCNECKGQFTVTVGTVFERSKIPLSKWLLANHLMNASKKGISAHQLHRMLGVTYKTAWFMAHRIREAMKDDAPAGPLGGEGKIVEADETYYGPKDRVTKRTRHGKPSHSSKRPVVALVERGGNARMFYVEKANAAELREILVRNVSRKSALHTDESRLYTVTGAEFASHRTVTHSHGEYVRYEDGGTVHTNSAENIFSVFKRGMHGVYQHCGEAHLHRYLAEFTFRHNKRAALGFNDDGRAEASLKGIEGKRLTYRRIGEAANA
jgi:transposase-like protein